MLSGIKKTKGKARFTDNYLKVNILQEGGRVCVLHVMKSSLLPMSARTRP